MRCLTRTVTTRCLRTNTTVTTTKTASFTHDSHTPLRPRRNMASTAGLPYKMHVTPDNTGLWRIKQTDEAAKKASELLQEDMEKHHVFFNKDGFHNHIPHHLLALYGTGADPAALTAAYKNNASYQRDALPPHQPEKKEQQQLTFHPWPAAAEPYLGKEEYYPDFLRFFQSEIARLGGSWQAVVAKYVFNLDLTKHNGDAATAGAANGAVTGAEDKGDQRSDDLLVRLFAGFLHPLIQLMYGVEWGQEAVVAEGLAQAAVHSNDIGAFLLGAEKAAAESRATSGSGEGKGDRAPLIAELLAEAKANEKLARSASMKDANKVRDGVLKRAKDEMIALAAKVRVRPDEVEERTAEMFNTAVFVAAAAALVKQGKQPKFDFFLMHHVNASPIFVTLNAQPWIPAETKARLLEWKIRMDLLQYVARGVPELSWAKLASYEPKKPEAGGSLSEIVARLHTFPDDGHAIKLGRATGVCRDICKEHEEDGKGWVKVGGDDMWQQVSHLIVDSVEAGGEHWVRSCGFDEAWKNMPDI